MNIPQKIGTNYETFGTLLLNDRQGEKINLKVEPSLEPLAENMEGRLSIIVLTETKCYACMKSEP